MPYINYSLNGKTQFSKSIKMINFVIYFKKYKWL